MNNYPNCPLPILNHSNRKYLFDILINDYKKIFKNINLSEKSFLKLIKIVKKYHQNNQKKYTYKQYNVLEKFATYHGTTICGLNSNEKEAVLKKANIINDGGYDCKMSHYYLIDVIPNNIIQNIIDIIPPVTDGFLIDKDLVISFIERRNKIKERNGKIKSILS